MSTPATRIAFGHARVSAVWPSIAAAMVISESEILGY
jgi:hypothetical protein